MPWPTNTTAMRNALSTRLYNWNAITVESSGTSITSNQDDDLLEVKLALNYGKVLKVSTKWSYYSNISDPNRDKTIFYRFGSNGMGHAVTIVGYDDDITYDINGNGNIEDGEKGAFKVANSHGSGFGDNGFFWVMYDALNEVSSVTGDWDNQNTRVPAFEGGSAFGPFVADNVFTYIYVEDKSPLFLAELTLEPHNEDGFLIQILNQEYGLIDTSSNTIAYGKQDFETTQNRIVIIDFEKALVSSDPTTPMYWGIRLCYNYSTYTADMVESAKLTDNKGTLIKNMNITLDRQNAISCDTFLFTGDLDYDGVLTSNDASKIMEVCANYSSISTIQTILADYNQDGKVTLSDVSALLKDID